MNRKPPSAPPESDPMAAFYEGLEDLAIQQARRLINLSIYSKALLSMLPVALIATDRDGLVRMSNKAAQDILGFQQEELTGKPAAEIFRPESEVGRRLLRALEDAEPAHLASRSLKLPSGKTLVGNLYLQPFRDEENALRGLLVTVEDLSYVHFLHDAFKRYVPPSVSEMIARNPQELRLGGEEKNLSVLFADIEDFTRYSESHTPNEMVTLLSEYFTVMTDEVFAFEGTLKEYVGDELMAIFGAPVEQSDHPSRACRAALAMQAALGDLRRRWRAAGRPAIRARIGVNTGPMLVGNLGSPYRFSYGVLGDQVNLASRLEGLCAVYGTPILIGERTAQAAGAAFRLREIDWVRVKGRVQSVRIYELLGEADGPRPAPAREAALAFYAEALEAYRKRSWVRALHGFEQAAAADPEDGPSRVMAGRCKHFLDAPPPEDWEGVFEHTRK